LKRKTAGARSAPRGVARARRTESSGSREAISRDYRLAPSERRWTYTASGQSRPSAPRSEGPGSATRGVASRTPLALLHFARNLAELRRSGMVRVPGGPPHCVDVSRGWRGAESAGLRLDSTIPACHASASRNPRDAPRLAVSHGLRQ
jgi:hypothetical protein